MSRAQAVRNEFPDVFSRPVYLAAHLRKGDIDAGIQGGDRVRIPFLPNYTVTNVYGAATAAPQAHGVSSVDIIANQMPFIPVTLPAEDRSQVMNGNFAAALARQIMLQILAYQDDQLASYLLTQCYDASATYHDNANGDSLTQQTFFASAGRVVNAGALENEVEVWINPRCRGQIQGLGQHFVSAQGSPSAGWAIPLIGYIGPHPVFSSRSIPAARTVASTAWATNGSSDLTITVAAGHNFVPGERIVFDTVTAAGDLVTSSAISTVTATTVVVNGTALAASGGATEAGTITAQSAPCLVVDRGNAHTADQVMPTLREVPVTNGPHDVLQAWTLYGQLLRTAGFARVLHLAVS